MEVYLKKFNFIEELLPFRVIPFTNKEVVYATQKQSVVTSLIIIKIPVV
jgi:hypothetical protein